MVSGKKKRKITDIIRWAERNVPPRVEPHGGTHVSVLWTWSATSARRPLQVYQIYLGGLHNLHNPHRRWDTYMATMHPPPPTSERN